MKMGFDTAEVMHLHNEMMEQMWQKHKEEEERAREAREEEERLARIRLANQRRDDALISATNRILDSSENPEDFLLIRSQLVDWKNILVRMTVASMQSLIENTEKFPEDMQKILANLRPIFQLNIFNFSEGLIKRSELQSLLEFSEAAFLSDFMPVQQSDKIFLTKLQEFVSRLKEEQFNDQYIFCLYRIINDYQINLLGNHNLINHILVNQLMGSETLAQLSKRPQTTQQSNTDESDFQANLDSLRNKVRLLPLNHEVQQMMDEVILSAGVQHIISYEQKIIDHFTQDYGRLYDLHDKLVLHTDHVSPDKPEEYRKVLHRLLINFFGAAKIADEKGCLEEFCQKMCTGFCFEKRVEGVFLWVTTLETPISFDKTMEIYIEKEYKPYATTFSDVAENDIWLADSIVDFIMTRHRNAYCLDDAIYAPKKVVTLVGVKKYIGAIYGLYSRHDRQQAIIEINVLRLSLQTEATFFWNFLWRTSIQKEISVLHDLNTQIEPDDVSLSDAAKNVKIKYPAISNSWFYSSKTGALLDRLELNNATFTK